MNLWFPASNSASAHSGVIAACDALVLGGEYAAARPGGTTVVDTVATRTPRPATADGNAPEKAFVRERLRFDFTGFAPVAGARPFRTVKARPPTTIAPKHYLKKSGRFLPKRGATAFPKKNSKKLVDPFSTPCYIPTSRYDY